MFMMRRTALSRSGEARPKGALLSLLLAAVLALSMLPALPQAARASEGESAPLEEGGASAWDNTARTVNLVQPDGFVSGVRNPAQPTASPSATWANGGNGSYVYFGRYFIDSAEQKDPLRWRLLDKESASGNAASDSFLLQTAYIVDQVLWKEQINHFDEKWNESNLRKWMRSESFDQQYDSYTAGGFWNTAFTPDEQAAVKRTTWPARGNVGLLVDMPLADDTAFILSGAELLRADYGFAPFPDTSYVQSSVQLTATPYAQSQGATVSTSTNAYGSYWTRSYLDLSGSEGMYDQIRPAAVDSEGAVYSNREAAPLAEGAGALGLDVPLAEGAGTLGLDALAKSAAGGYEGIGVAPALNLGWDGVLYFIDAGASRAESLSGTALSSGNEWGVAVLNDDAALRAFVAGGLDAASPGSQLSVQVTGVDPARGYNRISAMLVNSAGAVMAYGPLADKAEDGTYALTIPQDMQWGDYTLKVFAEKADEDARATAVASRTSDVALKVTDGQGGAALQLGGLAALDATYGDDMGRLGQSVRIDNVGLSQAANVSVSTNLPEVFEVRGGVAAIAPGDADESWSIVPKGSIDAGAYQATVTVTYETNGQIASLSTALELVVHPKQVVVTTRLKESEKPFWRVGSEQSATDTTSIYADGDLVWEEDRFGGFWNTYDHNEAAYRASVAQASNPDYPEGGVQTTVYDQGYNGPLEAVYQNVEGETVRATVLYDGSAYLPIGERIARPDAGEGGSDGWIIADSSKPYPTIRGLSAGSYSVTAHIEDPNYVSQRLDGVYNVDLQWGKLTEDGEYEYPVPSAPPEWDFEIDYAAETVTVYMENGVEIHEANTKEDFTGQKIANGASVSPFIGEYGEEPHVVYLRVADNASAFPSAATAVTVPTRPQGPQGLGSQQPSASGRGDGKITGVTTAMQYRPKTDDGTGVWQDVYADGSVEVPAGTYEVRYKADYNPQRRHWDAQAHVMRDYEGGPGNAFASSATVVEVEESQVEQPGFSISGGEDGLLMFEPNGAFGIGFTPEFLTVELANTGKKEAALEGLALYPSTGGDPYALFEFVDATEADKVLKPGESRSFKIRPGNAFIEAAPVVADGARRDGTEIGVVYDGGQIAKAVGDMVASVGQPARVSQKAPGAPVVESVGAGSVTLEELDPAQGRGGVRYGWSTEENGQYTWQESPVITGLAANTAYWVKQKYAGNGGYLEAVSPATQVEVEEGAAPEVNLQAATYAGDVAQTEFTFGDVVTVKGSVSAEAAAGSQGVSVLWDSVVLATGEVGGDGSFSVPVALDNADIPADRYGADDATPLAVRFADASGSHDVACEVRLAKKEVTVEHAASGVTKPYDGTTAVTMPDAITATVPADQVVGGLAPQVVVGSYAYASADAGTDVPIVASDVSLSGENAGFYRLAASGHVDARGSITPVPWQVGEACVEQPSVTYVADDHFTVTARIAGASAGSPAQVTIAGPRGELGVLSLAQEELSAVFALEDAVDALEPGENQITVTAAADGGNHVEGRATARLTANPYTLADGDVAWNGVDDRRENDGVHVSASVAEGSKVPDKGLALVLSDNASRQTAGTFQVTLERVEGDRVSWYRVPADPKISRSVVIAPAKPEVVEGVATLSAVAGASVPYDGAALQQADVVAQAAYGAVPATADQLSYQHRAAGATDGWRDGLPTDAGAYDVRITLAAWTDVTAAPHIRYEQRQVEARVVVERVAPPAAASASLVVKNGVASVATFDFATLLPALGDGLTWGDAKGWTLGSVNVSGGYYDEGAGAARLEGSVLTLPIQPVESSAEGPVGTVTAVYESGNFNPVTAVLNVSSANRAQPVVSGVAATPITYGQAVSESALSATFVDPQTGREVAGTLSWDDPGAVPDAGDAAPSWTFAPDDSATYQPVSGTVPLSVARRSVEVALTGDAAKAYDGTTAVPTGHTLGLAVTGGVLASDAGQVEAMAAAYTFAGKNAYENAVVASGVSLFGARAHNYALPAAARSGVEVRGSVPSGIAPREIVLVSASIAPRAYDGSLDAPVAEAVFDNLVPGEQLVVGTDVQGAGVYADANAGAGKRATNVSVQLLGSDAASNYVIAADAPPVSAVGEVVKAVPAVTGSISVIGEVAAGSPLSVVGLSGAFSNDASGDPVPGSLAWSDPSLVFAAGEHEAMWTFVPQDSANYEPVSGTVAVRVAEAPNVGQDPGSNPATPPGSGSGSGSGSDAATPPDSGSNPGSNPGSGSAPAGEGAPATSGEEKAAAPAQVPLPTGDPLAIAVVLLAVCAVAAGVCALVVRRKGR